jgi:hypothetical protein
MRRDAVVAVVFLLAVVACKKSKATAPTEPSASAAPSTKAATLDDVWRGLRWDLKREAATDVLTRQGLKVTYQPPRKGPDSWLSTEVDGAPATIYFDEKGRMTQITIVFEKTTNEIADGVKGRLTKRFGAAKETTTRSELTWGARSTIGPWAKLVVKSGPKGWTAHQEYGRVEATGPVGALDLVWAEAVADVEKRLRTAQYDVKSAGTDNVAIRFSKANEEGSADVSTKRGLVQLSWTLNGFATEADATNSAKERIEARYGGGPQGENATMTKWTNASTEASLDVRLKRSPETSWSAIESYRPIDADR